MVENRPREKIKACLDAARMLATYLFLPALLLLFATAASGTKELPAMPKMLFSTFGYGLALALIAQRYTRKCGSFAEAAGFHLIAHPPGVYVRAGAAGVLLGLAVACILPWLPAELLETYDVASAQAFQGEARYLAVLVTVLFAPLSEEIFFRGFLLQTLSKRFSYRISIAVTAIIFALLHINPVWMGYALLMGLLFGWLAWVMENLAISIAMHMGFNITALAGLFPAWDGATPFQAAGVRLIALAVFLCLAVVLIKKMLSAGKSERGVRECP